MSTTAQATSVAIDQLRDRIADALGVHRDHVQVSIRSSDEWTEIDATIQVYKS